ncbi:hypothetical protein ACFWP3_39865 [Streptomyces sp. NPDC058525]|uniref:hypothetical protein n=1 Tax=Streptomyces sp. NPDC058525 TaxID=3346538 RepID=UPI0036554D4E
MTAQPVRFDGPGDDRRRLPPMPERTPQALRLAIQDHAPHLPPDFEAHWRRAIGDTFNLTSVPVFLHLWWTQYAIARDRVLEARLADLQARAAKEDDPRESSRLLAGYSRLRVIAASVEPGE